MTALLTTFAVVVPLDISAAFAPLDITAAFDNGWNFGYHVVKAVAILAVAVGAIIAKIKGGNWVALLELLVGCLVLYLIWHLPEAPTTTGDGISDLGKYGSAGS